MLPVADLTFNQLRMALTESGIADRAISSVSGKIMIDVGEILNSNCSSLGENGVAKFLTKLLNAAILAQAIPNQKRALGQKLIAFSSQVSTSGDFAVTTFTIKGMHQLNSLVSFFGPTN
jgi:hypothetical protein